MQRPGRRESFRLRTSSTNKSFASKRPWPATGPKVRQYPPLAPDVSPASRGDRLAHSEQVISALIANSSEDDSLRVRVIQLEDTARSVCQRFQIHHYGRSVSPLPDELPPDKCERIYGPTGLGS